MTYSFFETYIIMILSFKNPNPNGFLDQMLGCTDGTTIGRMNSIVSI